MTGAAAAHDVGQIVETGDRSTLIFRRHLPHPPQEVWSALTDPSQLAEWYMAQATIDGRPGGSVDFVAGPSQFHVTGRILVWDPPRVLEHEWKVAPRRELPSGEDAVIRWALQPDGNGTLLSLEHRNLTRSTASGFVGGTHAFLDRLAAQLDGRPIPNWKERTREVAPFYPPAWGR